MSVRVVFSLSANLRVGCGLSYCELNNCMLWTAVDEIFSVDSLYFSQPGEFHTQCLMLLTPSLKLK